MERKVRNAAKALIIQDDKMLAIKISDGKEEWYIMPGGGQDVEELLPDTVCREVAEELLDKTTREECFNWCVSFLTNGEGVTKQKVDFIIKIFENL